MNKPEFDDCTDQLLGELKNKHLLREQLFIAGRWRDGTSADTFSVVNPATGDIIAHVADAGLDDVENAIQAAAAAQPLWAAKTAKERSQLLRAWFDLIQENRESLAQLLTLEQGKPLVEARGEIAYGASYIDWFADEARRIYGDLIPAPDSHTRLLTIKQPVGVVGAITPWNFPCAMLARKMAPALAAGCTLVAKPAAETPLSALALAHLASEAGIPAGVVNIVPSRAAEAIGQLFCRHPLVRKITFTGSTNVGKQLIAQAAGGVKRLSMELGGNAPFIVFDDADIPAAIAGALASKFRNTGQTCVCANRFYVQRRVYEKFFSALTSAVRRLVVGQGLAETTQLGPLISAKAIKKVSRLVESAVREGAVLAYQTPLPEAMRQRGFFYPPQILINVPAQAEITREEIFGPVVALIPFETEEEVIALCNDSPVGLAAYFYTRNSQRQWRLANALATGMVGINTGLISNEMAPFGGVKQSGWGREGSRYGIDDYLDIKYICEHMGE